MRIALKELANMRQVWHKEEMYQINIQRTSANILQWNAHESQLGEVLMVVAEVHKCDGKQSESRHRQGNDSPRHAHIVPLQGIECTEYGKEPLRVHYPLCLVPITVYDVTVKEERKIEGYLNKARILQEVEQVGLPAPIACCPREILRLIIGFIEGYRHQE